LLVNGCSTIENARIGHFSYSIPVLLEVEMWSDIEKVYLVEQIPVEIEGLQRTLEKLEASRFVAGHDPFYAGMVVESGWRRKVWSWFTWASLVAFAAIEDSLKLDLEGLGVFDRWWVWQEKHDVYQEPLIAVLMELRNYEVHLEFREVKVRDLQALLGSEAKPGEEPQKRDFGESVFIAEVDYISLSRLRNIQSGKSPVTAEMVDWFNRQASTWPAAYLIGRARESYTGYIAQFLKQNNV